MQKMQPKQYGMFRNRTPCYSWLKSVMQIVHKIGLWTNAHCWEHVVPKEQVINTSNQATTLTFLFQTSWPHTWQQPATQMTAQVLQLSVHDKKPANCKVLNTLNTSLLLSQCYTTINATTATWDFFLNWPTYILLRSATCCGWQKTSDYKNYHISLWLFTLFVPMDTERNTLHESKNYNFTWKLFLHTT